MAKLKGPLFSLIAHGSLGPRLVFSQRKRVSQVRFQRPQKDYTNTARATQRGYFSMSMGWWSELNATEKAEWLVLGRTDC